MEQRPGKFNWWACLQNVVTFTLGVWVLVDAILQKGTVPAGKWIVGLLLIGVMPLDGLIRAVRRK